MRYHTSAEVKSIQIKDGVAEGIKLENEKYYPSDIILSNADRFYTEEYLLPSRYREYQKSHWGKAKSSYSALLLFLGANRKIPQLAHHNFFFAENWNKHLRDIENGELSENPSFYINMPSVTDTACAPSNMENIFVLVPIPNTPSISSAKLAKYGDKITQKLISIVPDLKEAIIFQKRWYPQDFADRYNLFQGSALGLAQTLFQTGPLRPSHKNKQIKNLYYVGSTTNPGIGIPTCLVSAMQIFRDVATRDIAYNSFTKKPFTKLNR